MKKIVLVILISSIYKMSFGQILIYTPTGVGLSAMEYTEQLSESEIAYYDSIWQANISSHNPAWDATIIGSVSCQYNCHGFAWHVADGGNKVEITGSGNVQKYFSGNTPTYVQTTEVDTLEKVVYYYDDHSAITTQNPDFVISKWGGGPLVRHHIADCPYDGSTVIYYKLNMTGISSIPKGTVADVTTLHIQGGTYNWYGDSYVCASGGYFASVTGLETTPSYGKCIFRN